MEENMRNKIIAIAVLSLLIVSLQSPRSGAMTGGTLLTAEQEKTGVFEIATYDGATYGRRCTATVLNSSAANNRTWLVTAAHCFSYTTGAPLFAVTGHFSSPRARVSYETDPDGSGSTELWTDRTLSQVYINSAWRYTFVPNTYQGTPGIAFIRVNMAIPIYDSNGVRINEFRRAIYTGSPGTVSPPYSNPAMENFSRVGFCGQGDENLRCDRLTNIWWSPNFRNQFFQMPRGAFTTGFWSEGKGDEGGPLLKYAPGLTKQWEGAGSVRDIARFGTVLGVLQAPTVICDLPANGGKCDPMDGLAARFGDIDIEAWLNTINDARQDIPRINQWPSMFMGLFQAGGGSATNLSSAGVSQYTFPAYAGRIVGFSVNQATDQTYTWYDSGHYSIGTRSDLDIFTQFPLDPDVTPTRTFRTADGKPISQIVSIALDPSGYAHTWYRDGTHVIGAPNDLDSIQQPLPYGLPPGKTAADVVAITTRASGGVRAYYRDGTYSEGVYYDLNLFEPPRAFQTGNNRRPDEIIGVGVRSGQVVTLFEHPRY
jgi:hypothetical protein